MSARQLEDIQEVNPHPNTMIVPELWQNLPTSPPEVPPRPNFQRSKSQITMLAMEVQMDKDQLDFENAKRQASNQFHPLDNSVTTNSVTTPISHIEESNPLALWQSISLQRYETVLHMLSQTPPSVLGIKDDGHFLCSFYSGYPANVISLHTLRKYNPYWTSRFTKRATNASLFNNHIGRAQQLFMTAEFCWLMGGKRFLETFYVDDIEMLRQESMVLGWHFQMKHRIAINYATSQIKIPYTKFLVVNETQTAPRPHHPQYQSYN
jgi:hypothetical protein